MFRTRYHVDMVAKDPRRESHFPAIEKKYGEPISYWFTIMAKIGGKKYLDQIAHLRENYGFSQAHANALVMYSRGSTSAHRHESLSDYFKSIAQPVVRFDAMHLTGAKQGIKHGTTLCSFM